MSETSLLSLARIDTSRLELLWRTLCAMPAKTRVHEEHVTSDELVELLEPMLGQPAWVLASLLEAVLAERGSFARRDDGERGGDVVEYRVEQLHGTTSPELVWSGDTGSRVPARKTRYVIEDLFAGTTKRVLIAGYSFDHATDLFEPLFKRAEQLVRERRPVPKVRVVLDCSRVRSQADADADELARRAAEAFLNTCWTQGTLTPELVYYRPSTERTPSGFAPYSMHAKCIIVDGSAALVGSANFSNRGRDRNLEVGALIRDHHFVQSLLAAWDDVNAELVRVELPVLREHQLVSR